MQRNQSHLKSESASFGRFLIIRNVIFLPQPTFNAPKSDGIHLCLNAKVFYEDEFVVHMNDMKVGQPLQNSIVTLEPATGENLELLVKYTFDPISQGPYKRVPNMSTDEVKYQILNSRDRWYFLISRTQNRILLGRFYSRAWRFQMDLYWIDWELNIIIADPSNRGKGYGTAVQALAAEFLLQFPMTLSVFAYNPIKNIAEQRALEKAGFKEEGLIPISYYRVPEPRDETLRPCILYGRRNEI